MNDQHEKYISIEYSVWESKYKPMEWEVERLKRELENKEETITLMFHTQGGWPHYRRPELITIATVRVSIDAGYSLKDFDKKRLIKLIEQELDAPLQTTEQIQSIEDKLNKLPRIIKWLFKLNRITESTRERRNGRR